MDYTTLTVDTQNPQQPQTGHLHSLYEVCLQVKDGRAARGKHYELAALSVLLLTAKLAGETSLLGASEWVKLRSDALRVEWKHMPCANTYRYALERLDSQKVNAIVAPWFVRQEVQRRCGDEPSRLASQSGEQQGHLAIDGKALKGTGTQAYGGDAPQQHVLHVYEVQTGIVLAACRREAGIRPSVMVGPFVLQNLPSVDNPFSGVISCI